MYCPIIHNCSKRLLGLWYLYGFLACALVFGMGAGAYFSIGHESLMLSSMIMVIFISFLIFYLPLAWKNMKYTRKDGLLKIEKGVFFRRRYIIPRGQIQYITLRKTPFERIFGICTVEFHTGAGKRTLCGLSDEDGERLKEVLERGR